MRSLEDDGFANGVNHAVGYCRPPVHTRFQPGVSGNPSGRARGSQNLGTLFRQILKEEVSLREGTVVRKVSKAEAVLRGLVVGAMKGDPRSVVALFKLAEQTGQLAEPAAPVTSITRVIVDSIVPAENGASHSRASFPAVRQISRE